MNAKLKPLDGKYYGTEIEIKYYETSIPTILTIWATPKNVNPSERDLEKYGVTREQFESDPETMGIYDSHYESAESLKIANAIIAALNAIKTE